MSDLSTMLAEAYGTHQTSAAPSDEDMQKQASINLFAKLAADHGVDLNKLSDEQVNELYSDFLAKMAEEKKDEKKEPPPAAKKDEKKDEEEKEAAARAEFQLQKEAEAKVAEADYLGRVMAHAYVNELKKIAGQMPPQFAANAEKKKDEGEKKDEKKDEKDEGEKKASLASLGAGLRGTPAQPTVLKQASAIDRQAAEYAVKIAHEAGLDAEMVGAHLDARLLLGVQESTKTAGVEDFETARHIRALELLEQIGVPVTWKESALPNGAPQRCASSPSRPPRWGPFLRPLLCRRCRSSRSSLQGRRVRPVPRRRPTTPG